MALVPLFVITGASGWGKAAVLAPLARGLRGRCATFDVGLLMDPADARSGGQPILDHVMRSLNFALNLQN